MGEGPGLAATGTRYDQQRPFVVIHRPALGVVEAGQKAHEQRLQSLNSAKAALLPLGVLVKNGLKSSLLESRPEKTNNERYLQFPFFILGTTQAS